MSRPLSNTWSRVALVCCVHGRQPNEDKRHSGVSTKLTVIPSAFYPRGGGLFSPPGRSQRRGGIVYFFSSLPEEEISPARSTKTPSGALSFALHTMEHLHEGKKNAPRVGDLCRDKKRSLLGGLFIKQSSLRGYGQMIDAVRGKEGMGGG